MAATKFYQPGSQRAARVEDLFSKIARRYDLINDLQSFGLHRLWKSRLLGLAQVRPGETALDVCCGTGDLVLGLARRGGSVVGLDFSGPMLGVARTRLLKARSPGRQCAGDYPTGAAPTFIRADAQRLPCQDNSFDIVTVGYGLRNLADWEAGLREMHRVAKRGGRVLVLEFGKPSNRLWRALYFAYLRLIVPALGGLVAGDSAAYAYILESLEHYGSQEGVAAKMRDLGLRHTRVINLMGGVMSIHYGVKGSEK